MVVKKRAAIVRLQTNKEEPDSLAVMMGSLAADNGGVPMLGFAGYVTSSVEKFGDLDRTCSHPSTGSLGSWDRPGTMVTNSSRLISF